MIPPNVRKLLRILVILDGCPSHLILAHRTFMSHSQLSRSLATLRSLEVRYESVRGVGYRLISPGVFDLEAARRVLRGKAP